MLKAELAAYLPPGSDRESAIFKTLSRADNERAAQIPRRGLMDVNYEPRMKLVRKKPIYSVRMDPKVTKRRLAKKAQELCSKGAGECRVSNARVATQLGRLKALSPKVDEAMLSARLHGGAASEIDGQSILAGGLDLSGGN